MHWILAIAMTGSSTASIMRPYSTEAECRKALEEFFEKPHGKAQYSGSCFDENDENDRKFLKLFKG
ncbi:hypothetical protein [Pseudomonas savastanoi]|uniref:hypothetical protein n=1 Tax=Pseudomonas savastanoi TaxID=29438 RepID=UPI000EFE8FD0|nr:hypothetical protein [Pseudomonas savastanoi]RML92734.1 hypothetical protein ALQ87_03349 [Pseudomonas savastanoi pv. glycinea]